MRRRHAPSSHVSNETYSEPNGREDPRRLVSTALGEIYPQVPLWGMIEDSLSTPFSVFTERSLHKCRHQLNEATSCTMIRGSHIYTLQQDNAHTGCHVHHEQGTVKRTTVQPHQLVKVLTGARRARFRQQRSLQFISVN